MKNYKKDFNRGNRRGNSGRNGGFDRKPVSFRTTCNDCGNDCTVPFKPNGRKPVLCSNCFKGSDQGRSGRSDFRERKPFKRPFGKPSFDKRSSDSGLRDEIKRINRKLDQIIEILEEVTVAEEDEE